MILGIIIIFIGGGIIGWNCDKNYYGLLGTIIVIIGIFILVHNIKDNVPTAMDVYQGKTTLEITYKDGVPIDSVVVFKEGVTK